MAADGADFHREFIWLDGPGGKLAATLDLPAGSGPCPCVVFCHGFTGQRIEAHYLFAACGAVFARAGIAAIRFDFRGCGESFGNFADAGLEDLAADAAAALDFADSYPRFSRIGLLGLSLGGAVAMLACSHGAVEALALWAPLSFPSLLAERLPARDLQPGQPGYDVGGIVVGPRFAESLRQAEPVEVARRFHGPVLVVHGTHDTVIPAAHSKRLAEALGGRCELELIDGADHTFARADWQSQAISAAARFFSKHLL